MPPLPFPDTVHPFSIIFSALIQRQRAGNVAINAATMAGRVAVTGSISRHGALVQRQIIVAINAAAGSATIPRNCALVQRQHAREVFNTAALAARTVGYNE